MERDREPSLERQSLSSRPNVQARSVGSLVELTRRPRPESRAGVARRSGGRGTSGATPITLPRRVCVDSAYAPPKTERGGMQRGERRSLALCLLELAGFASSTRRVEDSTAVRIDRRRSVCEEASVVCSPFARRPLRAAPERRATRVAARGRVSAVGVPIVARDPTGRVRSLASARRQAGLEGEAGGAE